MTDRLFLHRLSLEEDRAELVPTNAPALRAQSFIDGRTDFSSGPARIAAIADFLEMEAAPAPTARMIFNVGFCGSTLLARLLDVPGRALVLREPNCLADLANQRAAVDRRGLRPEGFDDALPAVVRHLSRSWSAGEAVVVKPSNWANNLLPTLTEAHALLPLFLVTTRERYLRSVFRGGPDRLAFAARAAVHLSSGSDVDARLVNAALRFDDDQLDQLARVAVTGFEIQLALFGAVAERRGWKEHWLDQTDLEIDPFGSATRAARALELDLEPADIRGNVGLWAGRHAKDPDSLYSAETERKTFDALPEEIASKVDKALAWAGSVLASRV